MKKISKTKLTDQDSDDLLPEYRFDYSKAKPNRFAPFMQSDLVVVVLDPDMSKVFNTADSVNRALRAFIEAMPDTHQPKKARKAAA